MYIQCHFMTHVDYSSYHNQDTNYSITAKISPWCYLFYSHTQPSQIPDNKCLFSIIIIVSFWECHINGITHTSCGLMSLRSIQAVIYISRSFLFIAVIVLHSMDVPQSFSHLPIVGHAGWYNPWLLQQKLVWTIRHMFLCEPKISFYRV